jgi:protease-4
LVLSQRELSEETVKLISDGRILTGRKAKELGLVDTLGDRRTAKKWLNDVHEIDVETPIIEFDLAEKRGFWKEFLEGADAYYFDGFFFSRAPRNAIMAIQY